jgi:protease I
MIKVRNALQSNGITFLPAGLTSQIFLETNFFSMTLLSDIRVAILADDGVNQSELASTREQLEKAGVKVSVVSSRPVEVKAWDNNDWGIRIKVDLPLNAVSTENFEGLLIHGGISQADNLMASVLAINLVRQFFSGGKIVGAVGEGVLVLVSAEAVEGRQVTAPISLKENITTSGGVWVDEDVVSDNGLVTCRCEERIDRFNKVFLEELRQGVHQRTETII